MYTIIGTQWVNNEITLYLCTDVKYAITLIKNDDISNKVKIIYTPVL